jgi:repressor LexA
MSSHSLTQRQRSILSYIKRELRQKGYPPSVREMGEAVGLKSSSTVHSHLTKLEEMGYIRRDPTKPRAIEVLDDFRYETSDNPIPSLYENLVAVPLVGRITAGEPILAQESIEETYPLPAEFVKGEEVFMLSVRGDSMIEDGILDGDYVVVSRQSSAQNGDIVVALLEDEATVKRFYKENSHFRLQPSNSFMDPIIVTDVQILGKVVSLIRRVQ